MTIKTFIIASVAAATVASTAAADTYFGHGRTLDEGSVIELGLITAEGAGVVNLYDNFTDTKGKLLGSEELRAGANPDVRIDTGSTTKRDVIAEVIVDGEVVAVKKFDINS